MDKETYKRAKSVRKAAKETDKKLKKLSKNDTQYESKVKSVEKRLLAKEVEKRLKEMPIEELNKAKQGIRVSALKDARINNIYQLKNRTASSLEKIKGVGPKTAKETVKVVSSIVKSVETNAEIKIDNQNRRGDNDELVKNLYIERNIKEINADASAKYKETHSNTKRLLKDAKPARNFITWSLASKDKRERAIESLKELENIVEGEYKASTNELFLRKQQILKAKHDEYWSDYERNAAGYYASLSRIDNNKNVKKNLKSNAEVAIKNGLPEELAIAIGNVELKLDGLKAELRPYQRYAVQYIMNQGAVLLGDDMGLGKTVEAIASMVALKNEGGTHFLVVCPASVLINWEREVKKFSEFEVTAIHGTDAQEEIDRWIEKGGVGVTTYETLAKISIPDNYTFDMLVVDEAHYVKNPKAGRTENLLYFRQHTDRVIFMTGTPIENRVEEMCFLISCLKPEVAKSVYGSTSLALAPDFKKKIATVYFRRTKEDVLSELPEKIEKEQWCSLVKEEKALYAQYVQEGSFHSMRQVSFLVEKPEESSKAIRLMEIVDEALSENRKIIIFSFFLNTIEQIRKMFPEDSNYVFGTITGGVAANKRQEMVDAFTAYEGGAVLLSQIQAGGTGMNIQAASVIIFTEPQLKPSIENQAIARAYRMGQINTVMVHRLLLEKTVDEQIMKLLREKQNIFDNFADESVSGKESINDSKTIQEILEKERKRIEQ